MRSLVRPQNAAFPTNNIVIAHEGAAGVVKMRMDRMEAMGCPDEADLAPWFAVKNASMAPRSPRHLRRSPIMAANQAGFSPKAAGGKPTQALPEVWKDWRGFYARDELQWCGPRPSWRKPGAPEIRNGRALPISRSASPVWLVIALIASRKRNAVKFGSIARLRAWSLP